MLKSQYRGLGALVIARLREFRREPSAFFFVLFMPILWMLVLGPAFSHQKQDSFGVGFDLEGQKTPEGSAVEHALKSSRSLQIAEKSGDRLMTDLRQGAVQVIVRVRQGQVFFEFDPMSREAQRARDAANHAIQEAAGRQDPVLVQDMPVRVPGTRYVDFLIPGLLGMSILSTSIWGVGMTIVSNRKENLLKRLLATPMQSYHYILSHIIGRMFILLLEVGTQLLAARLLFQFTVAGSIGTYVLFSLIGAATLTAFGIMLGSRTANTGAMNGVANLFALPMMILSGAWFSRMNLPGWLAEAARFLPLSPLVDGLRRIALEGAGFSDLGFEVGLLGTYFVLFSAVAAKCFKWY